MNNQSADTFAPASLFTCYRPVAFILFLLLYIPCHAQSVEDNLQHGVRYYNALRDYVRTMKAGKVQDSNINRVKIYIDRSTNLLQQVRQEGTTEQQKVARYFLMNAQYQLGFVMGMRKAGIEEYAVLKAIEPDFNYFSDSMQFPMRYAFFGKTYVIKYKDFSPTLSEYYTGLGELAFNTKKDEEGKALMMKAYQLPYNSTWVKYIAANRICIYLKKQQPWTQDFLEWNINALEQVSKLDTAYRSTIRRSNYADVPRYAGDIETILTQNPGWSAKGIHYARAAAFAEDAKDDQHAAKLYSAAIQQGLPDAGYLNRAINFAQRTGNSSLADKAAALKRQ